MAESPTDGIVALIRERALANGVDPAALVRFAQVESNLNPNAAAPGSSAKGLFQFTNGTAKQYGLADPFDAYQNADAGARLMASNAKALGTTDPGSLYLAHFAGAGGAKSVLSADPSASAGSILGQAAVKANPFLANMTVGDLQAWAARKGGGAAPAPSAQPGVGQPQNSAPVAQASAAAPAMPADAGGGVDPAMMAALQAVAQAGQQSDLPAPEMPKINYVTPASIHRARALSRAMASRSLV